MRTDDKERICKAVQECLQRCYSAADPLVQAVDYVDQLRQTPQWDTAAISQVENMVLRAVRVIVRQARDPCCHERHTAAPGSLPTR